MTETTTVASALVSVSDKRGVVEFCRALVGRGVEILSTGGTARQLRDGGVAVVEVSDYTGFPELLDGRVKTLHPKIHAGLLARRGVDDAALQAHNIARIDLVAVNLYPFEETVAEPECGLEQAIENIDIGGPTLLRAAAKNHRDTAAVVDPDDYARIIDALDGGGLSAALRFDLAVKAFEHTAGYDAAIANYLGGLLGDGAAESGDAAAAAGDTTAGDTTAGDDANAAFPRTLSLQFRKKQTLRYGENPHQAAAWYVDRGPAGRAGDGDGDGGGGLATARQLQGKALSFNNIADADAAIACVRQFSRGHACVIVKHANPCGAAVATTQAAAYRRAFATDRESAFGGIIAFNRALEVDAARAIVDAQFAEVIAAPAVSAAALEALAAKSNIRVLECGEAESGGGDAPAGLDLRRVAGGLLVQRADRVLNHKLEVVTARAPSDAQMEDLLFAWQVAKFVKSNAIVYAAGRATIGVGAGQMSRVNSARIAAFKAQDAGLEVAGAVMASDAFIPIRDGIEHAAAAGARAVIQPGGSRRDDEVIAAANAHDMAMVFTGTRHFRH